MTFIGENNSNILGNYVMLLLSKVERTDDEHIYREYGSHAIRPHLLLGTWKNSGLRQSYR